MSCTYIYSSLDQTARKINVAKFVSKKVSVVLVTDIAVCFLITESDEVRCDFCYRHVE